MALSEKYVSGTIVAVAGAVAVPCANDAAVGFNITGTWVATLVFEVTTDDTTWVPIFALSNTAVAASGTAANGFYVVPVGGISQFRVRASAYTSGTVTINANADTGTIPLSGVMGLLPNGTIGQVEASANLELSTADICDNAGVHGAITVGTSAVLASVSGTNRVTRKVLTVYNNGTVPIYFGYTNAVTTAAGTPIVVGEKAIFGFGAGTTVYLISGTAGQDVRVTEAS